MVALLIRLQLKLTLRSFRGETSRIVALSLLSFFGAGMLLSFLVSAFFIGQSEVNKIAPVMTCLFAATTLLWPVALVLLGSNDPLTPTRFALFPVRGRELQWGMLAATLLTLGGIATSVLTLGYVIAWSARPLTLVLGVVCGVAGLAFSVLLARTLTSAILATLSSRRFRETAFVIIGTLAFVPAFAGQLSGRFAVAGEDDDPMRVLESAALVLGWTPFGWVWSLPGEVWNGRWAVAAAKAVAFGLTFWALWLLWRRFLDRALCSPLRAGSSARKVKGSARLERMLPATPAGAIAARTARYWLRDPRRKMQAMPLLILPVLFTVMLGAGSGARAAVIMPPVVIAMGALSLIMGEICYDGSAMATQLLTGASGREDRWGRILGVWMLLLPMSLLLCLLALAWSGRWELTGVEIGATLGGLGVVSGVGSWCGAVWHYPIPPLESNLNTRGNMSALVGWLVGTAIAVLLLVPVWGLAVAAAFVPVLAWVSPAISLLVGGLALWGGVLLGGRRLDQAWPEVLARITWERASA
ncbi:MAG: hypothetical protein Q3997_03650 [Propionibacteriaceae bacterium]|nr:hypothetical protein [Propionibacteriaceae bacterium]